nr:E3 ubiquitin-protein ligase NEURL1B isoform X2 [Crassostrea gigas]
MEWNLQKNYEFCLDPYDEEDETPKGSDYLEESLRNECERMKERRQAQTPIKKKNNKEELDKKYEKMVALMKQVQEESNGNLWHYTKVIGGGVLAGGLAVAAAPLALSAAGFTAGGIAAGSFASQLMSWAAIANGGGVAAGGLVATLQSAGAAGIGFFSNLLIGSAAGTAGSALAHTLSEKPGLSEGAENQCKICLDGKMDTVFEPCGHLFTCSSCAKKLRMCPICRKHIANNS